MHYFNDIKLSSLVIIPSPVPPVDITEISFLGNEFRLLLKN